MSEHDDMELKRAMDALPREIEPPADLWPGLRGRLQKRGNVGRWEGGKLVRIAALLAMLAGSAAALGISRYHESHWRLAENGGERTMTAGDSLDTGAATARLAVGTIGHLDVTAGTSLMLLDARGTHQRIRLSRGTIQARISAPPRIFIVETPSGRATDLGCEYTLQVDSAGDSHLHVTLGWVEFAGAEHTMLVPAGFSVVTSRTSGPGTPVDDSASAEFAAALRKFDARPMSDDSALADVLRLARRRDAVTLWHMIGRTGALARTLIVSRLTELAQLPDGVTPAALEHNNRAAMDLYWTTLPGTLPIIPSWQVSLWRLWLKVTG